MAILLVFDHDNVHTDSEKDYRGCYKKGYIVQVFEDGTPYVNPPAVPFLILQITGVTKAQVEEYQNDWRRTIEYTIVQRSIPLDGWRLDIKATNPNPSGKGHLTLEKVQNYLENWGASVVGIVDHAVRFDIAISTILQSPNLWGVDVSAIDFTELSYDEGTGVHRTLSDYNAVPIPPNITPQKFAENISQRVVEHGGTVISNAGGVITFDIGRDVVIQRVRSEVKEFTEDTICRRRIYLDPMVADQIIAAGRVMVATPAQVAPYVRNRQAE